MKPLKERKRRKLLNKAAERLAKIHEKKPEKEEAKPAPQSGTLSHEKTASAHEVRYNPKTAPGTRMIDTRGVPYDIGPKGQLRRVRKPQLQRTARVERIRESFREKRKKGNGTDGEKV